LLGFLEILYLFQTNLAQAKMKLAKIEIRHLDFGPFEIELEEVWF